MPKPPKMTTAKSHAHSVLYMNNSIIRNIFKTIRGLLVFFPAHPGFLGKQHILYKEEKQIVGGGLNITTVSITNFCWVVAYTKN